MLRRIIADVLFLRGIAMLSQGHCRSGRLFARLSMGLSPPRTENLAMAARAAMRAGEHRLAVSCGEQVLELDAELSETRNLLLHHYLQGPNNESILADIHEILKPRTYIEIGVSRGDSIRLVRPGTLALGVDPAPAVPFALPGNVRVFAETSDHFFAARDVRAELGGLPLDLAFIDGMHHFDFALRDFINLERLCARESTILVHDCFPIDRTSAERERKSLFWSGDIWRLIVLLKKYRPDLRIDTIGTPPTGLGFIRNLDPSSRFLADNVARLSDEFMQLDYGYLRDDRRAKLNFFPNDRESLRRLLAQVP